MSDENAKARSRAYYARHKDKIKAYHDARKDKYRAYYAANRDRILARAREYHKAHPEIVREVERARSRNPRRRLVKNLRNRVRKVLIRGYKSAPTLALLGCSRAHWRDHLESLFKPGMTWENYGSVWHVDHVRPCASFDLTDPAQQRACFHYTNTQPLFAVENLQKGDKCA